MKKVLTIGLFFSLALTVSAQEDGFKILRGKVDTVYSKTYDFIGQTAPGSSAIVCGESVPVYKTGAFGNRITLSKGDNKISVSVTKAGKTSSKEFNVFYADPKPSSPAAPAAPVPVQKINLTAKTKDGAYLQFGNGADRLGATKVGYLDEGVLLRLEEKQGDLYKVRLSDNRYAFIDEEYVEIGSYDIKKINSPSIRISNIGKRDRISIPLGEKLPYSSWTEMDPTKIYVNIYGAMNNSNWITHDHNLGMVDYVDVHQSDSDVLTVVIGLKNKYSWGYSVSYQGNNLIIEVKHTPSTSLSGLTIGLDAGHGKTSVGAVSITGLTENALNMKLVNLVKERLQAKGAKVVLTRENTEQDLTMTQRKRILKEADVDMLISIHNNAGGSPFVPMGTSTYYRQIVNRTLACCLYDRMLELGVAEYGVTGNFNFSLCAPTEYPDVLLEAMFMSSLPDEEKLNDEDFCKSVASKVVLAIEDYLKIVYKEDVKGKRK